MQNSLAVISPSEWDTLQQQATALVASGFLPQSIKTAQQAVAIMMLGRELGIPPWAALSTINVIQGKPTVSPQLMLALINRSGQLEDMYIEDDGQRCEVGMVRKGRTSHSFSFSMADAHAMGLVGKDNWKKQPAIMRQWRAVAGCARVVFPDVILGLYTPEEMGADVSVDGEGNMTIVDAATGEISPVGTQNGKQAPTPPQRPQNAPARPVDAPNASPSSTPSSQQPSGGSPDLLDQLFPPREPVTYTDFLCHELVYTVTNGGSQYTFKSEHGANIVVFGSEWVLGIKDYADRDAFKNTPGKVQALHPPLIVSARYDGRAKKWDVAQIVSFEAVTQ